MKNESKPKILLSACLAGFCVCYDGKALDNYPTPSIRAICKAKKVITICPELAGGLTIPRIPAEIEAGKSGEEVLAGQGRVINKEGEDVTAAYLLGAQQTLAVIKKYNLSVACLKSNSPACGKGMIYDGTFSHKLVSGNGVTVALLLQNNIKVFTEEEYFDKKKNNF